MTYPANADNEGLGRNNENNSFKLPNETRRTTEQSIPALSVYSTLSAMLSGHEVLATKEEVDLLLEAGAIKIVDVDYKTLSELANQLSSRENRLGKSNSTLKSLEADLNDKTEETQGAGYFFRNIFSGGTLREEDNKILHELEGKIEVAKKERTGALNSHKQAINAAEEIKGLAQIDGQVFQITKAGKEILAELEPRQILLTGKSYLAFVEELEGIHQSLQAGIDRSVHLLSLFQSAGMRIEDPSSELNVVTLSSANRDLPKLLAKATEFDAGLADYNLKEKEKLHLISILVGSDQDTDKLLKKLDRIVGELAPMFKSSYPGYREIYLAAHLCESDRTSVVAKFLETRDKLKSLGLDIKKSGTLHCAARLAVQDPEAMMRFESIYRAIASSFREDRTQVALAALSLQSLKLTPEMTVERLRLANKLLSNERISNTRLDLSEAAALAALPGALEAQFKLITTASRYIQDSSLKNDLIFQKALVLCGGLILQLGTESLTAEGKLARESLRLCGIDRGSASNRNRNSNYDSCDTSFIPYYFWFDGSSGTNQSRDWGNDVNPAAFCGSAGYSDPGSHHGGAHHGDSVGGSVDHGGSSCGTAASCGAASCASASCGGGGCGGGGCGGGGCGGM